MLHEAARAAHVQVNIVLRIGQDLAGIQCCLGLFIEMQEQAVGKRGRADALHKRCALAGASAVMQLEVRADPRQALGHAQDRRNADAAGKQQAAPGTVCQREQVARLADAQLGTTVDLFVHAARATP
ncbi:hypothetical protein D3C78_1487260 [compost metagenome]